MYIFWWSKPLLPSHPIILRDESLAALVTCMYSSSEMSGVRLDKRDLKSQTIIKTLFAHLSLYSQTPELDNLCIRLNKGTPGFPLVVQHAPDSCMTSIESLREKDSGTAFFERRPRVIRGVSGSMPLSPAETERFTLVQRAFHMYPSLLAPKRMLLAHELDGFSCVHLRSEQLLASHIQNWPSNDLIRNVDGLVVGKILWLANLCYGAFHAAAWNEHFPSAAEKWLWRGASSYIAFCGGFWVLLNSAVARWKVLNAFWETWMDGKKSLAQSLALSVIVFTCGFTLFAARMFIVVEAFISIRELPAAAYDTPQWADVFPHF